MRDFLNRIGANPVVLALSFGRLGDGVGNSILFVVIPLYVSQFPAPNFPFAETVRAGIVLSLVGFINLILQPLAGALIDRLNRRKIFVVGGLALLTVVTAAFALAGTYIDLLVLRLVQGVAIAVTVPATVAMLTNATEQRSRGGSMGVYSMFRVVGLAIGPLLGGSLAGSYGFAVTFLVGAAFIVTGVLLVQFLVPEVKAPERAGPGRFEIFDRKLFSASILALGFSAFVMSMAFTVVAPLEQEFNKRLSEGAFAFGLAFSALMITRIIVQVPLGRLSDFRGRKPLVILGLLIMAVATGFMGLVTDTAQFVGLRVVQGFASALIAAPVFALAGDMSKAGGEGRQMSLITMGFGAGIAVATLGAGLLATYSFELVFIVAGALSLAAALSVYAFVTETVAES